MPLVVWVEEQFKRDRYLSQHTRYYIREMRVKAYSQLLESYRSLSLAHMAKSFGVTEAFIDRLINGCGLLGYSNSLRSRMIINFNPLWS